MTCIEKVKELHPEWDEEIIENVIIGDCPSDHMRIDLPDVDCEVGACRACWNQEFPDSEYVGIPWEFEYIGRTTGEKHFVRITEKIIHHYTGETIYKTYTFLEDGGFDERYHREDEIRELLKMRVGG